MLVVVYDSCLLYIMVVAMVSECLASPFVDVLGWSPRQRGDGGGARRRRWRLPEVASCAQQGEEGAEAARARQGWH